MTNLQVTLLSCVFLIPSPFPVVPFTLQFIIQSFICVNGPVCRLPVGFLSILRAGPFVLFAPASQTLRVAQRLSYRLSQGVRLEAKGRCLPISWVVIGGFQRQRTVVLEEQSSEWNHGVSILPLNEKRTSFLTALKVISSPGEDSQDLNYNVYVRTECQREKASNKINS